MTRNDEAMEAAWELIRALNRHGHVFYGAVFEDITNAKNKLSALLSQPGETGEVEEAHEIVEGLRHVDWHAGKSEDAAPHGCLGDCAVCRPGTKGCRYSNQEDAGALDAALAIKADWDSRCRWVDGGGPFELVAPREVIVARAYLALTKQAVGRLGASVR